MAKVKCQFCSNKKEKGEMICVKKESKSGRITRKYYCVKCKELLDSRDKAIDKFYEYTSSLEPLKTVYLAFKKIKQKGLTEHDILYTIEYIIENKMVLNYPMGITYYIDRAMKDKKRKEQIKKNKEKIMKESTKPINIIDIIKNNKKETDEMDISDFIDEE